MKKTEITNRNGESGKGISGKLGLALWILAAAALLAACMFLQRLASSDNGRLFPVYISEVLAANTAYPNEDGRCCDFIEIFNSADYPFDLSGYQLGDIAGGRRYAFPVGTVIEAGAYYVVYCDETVEDAFYAPFAISRSGGESFYLIASNNAIVDSMTTIATDPDCSMIPLEGGGWGPSRTVSPGSENSGAVESAQDIYNPGLSPVRISEISAANTGYVGEHGLRCDWVELYNASSSNADISGFSLSDNAGNDKYIFPSGTVLAPGDHLLVYCSDRVERDGVAPFGLSLSGGEFLVFKNADGMIVEMIVTPEMTGGSYSLDPEGHWSLTEEISPGFDNSHPGHMAYLEAIGAAPGTMLISELMAAPQLLIQDCYGELSDWVELYNSGSSTVELSGWYLSDDPKEPLKWEFPSLELRPGERALVFCSGRDTAADGQLHTGFSLSAGGESLVLSTPSGIPVASVSFGISETNCSYIFDGESSEGLMTDCPSPGFSNDREGYELFCNGALPAGPLAIWEVMTSNDWYLPQALGECYDWVELRNISDEPVSLAAFSLSEDMDSNHRYTLPDKVLQPDQSVAIILSGDTSLSGQYAHADFALNAMEAQLYLFYGDSLSDCVYLKNIPLGYSYGRSAETGGFAYMKPSPERENEAGFRLISEMPTSEYAPGVYSSDSGFEVPLAAAGAIYYTLDGSDPDSGDIPYTGPIAITDTAVLRAISVEDGKLASEIYTATFIIGESHELPVISLVTDPANLWGINGIYKSGDISIKEEKRPANLAFSGDDGSFSINCEISLHGATTVTAFEKKSFTVRFHDNYDGPLNYDLFMDGEVTTFRSLIIRTAHESSFSSQMRDSLMGYVASQCSDSVLSQKFRYAALYINGEYWGLYAFREHHSEAHYASYMNVPASTVSIVRFCVDEPNSLHRLFDLCDSEGLRSEENFAYAKTVLDMNSVADWIIFEAYVGNVDIHGNMRYYYCSVDGLWRCGLVDVDLGMFSRAAFNETARSFSHGVLVSALLENEEFQDLIAKRLAQLLSGPMSDKSMIAAIDEIAAIIRPETPMEGQRWGCSPEMWERLVVEMKDYCTGRAESMINSLCSEAMFTPEEKEFYFGEVLRAQEGA